MWRVVFRRTIWWQIVLHFSYASEINKFHFAGWKIVNVARLKMNVRRFNKFDINHHRYFGASTIVRLIPEDKTKLDEGGGFFFIRSLNSYPFSSGLTASEEFHNFSIFLPIFCFWYKKFLRIWKYRPWRVSFPINRFLSKIHIHVVIYAVHRSLT